MSKKNNILTEIEIKMEICSNGLIRAFGKIVLLSCDIGLLEGRHDIGCYMTSHVSDPGVGWVGGGGGGGDNSCYLYTKVYENYNCSLNCS